jgi:oligoendopeptidase F
MLFARGLYADYLRDKAGFRDKYDGILRSAGCNNLYDVGLAAGVDVRDAGFWQSSFEIVRREIDEWVS